MIHNGLDGDGWDELRLGVGFWGRQLLDRTSFGTHLHNVTLSAAPTRRSGYPFEFPNEFRIVHLPDAPAPACSGDRALGDPRRL